MANCSVLSKSMLGLNKKSPAYLAVLFRVQFPLVFVFVHGQHYIVRGVFLNLNDILIFSDMKFVSLPIFMFKMRMILSLRTIQR